MPTVKQKRQKKPQTEMTNEIFFKTTKQLGGNNGRNYNGVIRDANGNKLTKDEDKKNRC